MTRPAAIRHRFAVAVISLLLTASALLLAGAASSARPAAAAEACGVGAGVTVVVDFGTLGGGVQVRCVTESVSSGLDALRKAGFTYTGTQRSPGLVCRIDGRPADDPCVNVPPADRYWSYWTAPRPGGAWTYSEQGAGNRTPSAGSVEGWAFSDGCERRPGSGPCPTPSTTTTGPPAPTPPPSDLDRGGGVGGGATPGDQGAADPGAPDRGTSAGPDASDTAQADDEAVSTSVTTDRSSDRAPGRGEEGDEEVAGESTGASRPVGDDGGSPVGVLVGVAAILALGVAGAATARRRRRVDPPETPL